MILVAGVVESAAAGQHRLDVQGRKTVAVGVALCDAPLLHLEGLGVAWSWIAGVLSVPASGKNCLNGEGDLRAQNASRRNNRMAMPMAKTSLEVVAHS